MIGWSAFAYVLVLGGLTLLAGTTAQTVGVPLRYCIAFGLAAFMLMFGLVIFASLDEDGPNDQGG